MLQNADNCLDRHLTLFGEILFLQGTDVTELLPAEYRQQFRKC